MGSFDSEIFTRSDLLMRVPFFLQVAIRKYISLMNESNSALKTEIAK